jgi:hypothetical protein
MVSSLSSNGCYLQRHCVVGSSCSQDQKGVTTSYIFFAHIAEMALSHSEIVTHGGKMKNLMLSAIAALGLGGCVAVPGPYSYYPENAYYYPAPAVSVGVYAGPGRYRHRYYGRDRW